MSSSLPRAGSQLQGVEMYPTQQHYNQFPNDPGTSYSDNSAVYAAAALASYPQYMPTSSQLQPQYDLYPEQYSSNQFQASLNTSQAVNDVTPLDPQLAHTGSYDDCDGKYIGYASGLVFLAELLRMTNTPLSVPWPHLACASFLAEMRSKPALASLPVPCRKTSSALLDAYDQVVSPLYPVYTRSELHNMLNNIYLNGLIARRDIAECTSNCFALVIGQVVCILARQNSNLLSMVQDCAQFSRSGLAEIFLKPSLCGVRYLLCILLTNHSRELADPIWYTSGMAMQMCVDLNLHNDSPPGSTEFSEDEIEERRRIFWTVYSVDRGLAFAFGRPLTLQESCISCSYPTRVSSAALSRFKIRRIQARIMRLQAHDSAIHQAAFDALPYPTANEMQIMSDLNQWQRGRDGEELIQGGNTELLLLRRAVVRKQPEALMRATQIITTNMNIYCHQALHIAVVEGILVVHDIFVNLITAIYIFKFGVGMSTFGLQTLYKWTEQMRPIFQSLSRHWSTAAESFALVEHLVYRLQEGNQ